MEEHARLLRLPLRDGGVYLFIGGLRGRNDRLAEHLGAHPDEPLADVAHTLRAGRRRFERRRVLVCRGREDTGRASLM